MKDGAFIPNLVDRFSLTETRVHKTRRYLVVLICLFAGLNLVASAYRGITDAKAWGWISIPTGFTLIQIFVLFAVSFVLVMLTLSTADKLIDEIRRRDGGTDLSGQAENNVSAKRKLHVRFSSLARKLILAVIWSPFVFLGLVGISSLVFFGHTILQSDNPGAVMSWFMLILLAFFHVGICCLAVAMAYYIQKKLFPFLSTVGLIQDIADKNSSHEADVNHPGTPAQSP